MFDRINKKEHNKNHTGHRSYILLCLVLVLGLFILTGCAAEEVSYINDAADYYNAGEYAEAEAAFLKAIRNNEKSVTVFSGYAFNQLKAGDIEGAEALLGIMVNQDNTYGNYFDREPETGEAVRRALLDIYLSKNKYEDAVALLKQLGDKATDKEKEAQYKASAALLAWQLNYENGQDQVLTFYTPDQLIKLVSDAIESGNESIKLYKMRANLYYLKEEWDLWEADERKIIDMKDCAIDEYRAIYGMRLKEKSPRDVLTLIDEMVIHDTQGC